MFMTDPLVVAKPIMLHQNRTLSVVQVSDLVFSGLFLNLFLAESWRMTRITEALRVLVGRRMDAGVWGVSVWWGGCCPSPNIP